VTDTKPTIREIPPEELILTLLDGAPTKLFRLEKYLPSGERVYSTIRIKVLRKEENLRALKAAQDTAKEAGEHANYGDIYREAQADEVLQRALCHPTKRQRPDGKTSYYPPLFTDARQLRMAFTEQELAVLLNAYEVTKAEYSTLEGLEEREAELWIARLSDPLQGPFWLSQLDSRHWPACIYMLAGMARDLYLSAGLALPSLQPTSVSSPESSTAGTGSSTEQPSASPIVGDSESGPVDDSVKVTPGELLTPTQARAIARKKKPEPETETEK
jgi:hypothetical protein